MTAFSDAERERLTQTFVTITDDHDAAAALVDRVADWTSFWNLRMKDVEKELVSALVGEVERVRRYGVHLTASATPAQRARELLDQTAICEGDFERY